MPRTVHDAKRGLRDAIRSQREDRPVPRRETDAVGIAAQLVELVASHQARSITCYLSTPTEPGTRAFLNAARDLRVLLPSSGPDGVLDWVLAEPDLPEQAGALNVPEPVGDLLGPAAANAADLWVIPAAAVDATGMRLGWGRGYYDRALAGVPDGTPVYAVIYDAELVDAVPTEAHDRPVTGVITPTRTLLFDSA